MASIFVRPRRHAGPGAGRPRFVVVAVEGTDLYFFRPWLRKSELDAIAAAVEAEVVMLPEGPEEDDRLHPPRRGGCERRRDAS